MKHNKYGKYVAVVVAVLMVALSAQVPMTAIASTGTGDMPTEAMALEENGNTGSLAPGDSIWYSFSHNSVDGAAELDASVTMFFTPNNYQNIGRVNFQVFAEDQIPYWNDFGGKGGDSTNMVNLGAGGLVERDGNPETVDLTWSGKIASGATYYVEVYNSAKEPINYWIFPADVKAVDLGPRVSTAPAPAGMANGENPFDALRLAESGTVGSLAPGESMWYSFSKTAVDGALDVNANLTMFFVPGGEQTLGRVNFQVFPDDQLAYWNEMGGKGGDSSKMVNLGAGGVVERDSNPATVDLLWSGVIPSGVAFRVQVYNSSTVPIDYWLYPEDVEAVDLGPALSPTPAPAKGAPGGSPADAITLEEGGDTGRLGPGESRWYTYSRSTEDGALDVEASLTMFFIPGTDQTIGRVNFQVFPADQLAYWSDLGETGGDSHKMVNLGAGGLVDRDSNPQTVDLLWKGTISADTIYYVQVYNSATQPIDYWIYPEDVRAIDLGPTVSAAPAPVGAPTGNTPFEALPLAETGDSESLAPGESTWYSFSVSTDDGALDVDASLTTFFIPGTDQTIGRVNYQVFGADELANWNEMGGKGGDSSKMVNLGAGGLVDRDSNPETVDLLWNGTISSGTIYYVEMYNSAKEAIHYWIFPGDVKAMNLGQ